MNGNRDIMMMTVGFRVVMESKNIASMSIKKTAGDMLAFGMNVMSGMGDGHDCCHMRQMDMPIRPGRPNMSMPGRGLDRAKTPYHNHQ
jgi:hypothetical protein